MDENTTSLFNDLDLSSYRRRVEALSQPLTREHGIVFWKNVRSAQQASQLAVTLITQSEITKMTGLELGEQLVHPSESRKVSSQCSFVDLPHSRP